MPNRSPTITDEILQESISAAKLILESCETMEPSLPKGKKAFTTNSESFIYQQIKRKASHELGLFHEDSPKIRNKSEDLITDISHTLSWIQAGKKIFAEQSEYLPEFLPNAYFLLYLELEDPSFERPTNFHTSYFVLALYLIAKYESSRLEAFGSEEDFGNPDIAITLVEKSSSSHEFLLISQSALELGLESKQVSNSGSGKTNRPENLEIIFNLAMESINHKMRRKKAAEARSNKVKQKWQHLFIKVAGAISDGHSIANACRIVARKYGQDKDDDGSKLRQAYYRSKNLK
jgi:hypothetical protein